MNADDMKRLLDRSLHEGGMEGAPAPDESSIAGRVRGARRRRAAGNAIAGVASIALVAAVVWQVGGFTNEPNPPATPTTTQESDEPTTGDPTDDPSADPTDTSTDGGDQTDPGDWSDAVFPECGDTFSGLPERSSQLVVTQGPSETLGAGGSFMSAVENTGSTPIQGSVALTQTVVVDSSGTVVATLDPADQVFWGPEGGIYLAIAAGETLPFRVSESWTCGGESAQLGSGEYEVYVMLTMGEPGVDDLAQLEQAQGGPFPMVIDDSVQLDQTASTPPDGAPAWNQQCGDAWTAPDISTGFEVELLDSIRTPRPPTDDIDGGSQVMVTQQVSGTIYNDVVLIRDGQVVSAPLTGDAQSEYVLSAGSQVDLGFSSSLLDCDGMTLPPGQYQAVVVTLLTQWTGGEAGITTSVIAAADPIDLVLN